MKRLKILRPSIFWLCLIAGALLLAMTPFNAMAANCNAQVLVDSFSPTDCYIYVGDTVTWTTQSVSAGIHIVSGDPSGAGYGPDGTCQETLNGFLFSVGDTYSHTFTTPGECHYVCLIHYVATGMKGVIHVLPPPSGAPGDLDPTFGASGKVTNDFSGLGDRINAMVIQPDGKIVVAGDIAAHSTYSTSGDFALLRYNANGSLDTTFGSGGKVTTDFLGSEDTINALALQPDGKIVAAGFASSSTSNDFALARYNPDGSLDTTFGSGGKVTTGFFGYGSNIRAVALQPDGKIVAAGSAGKRSFVDSSIQLDSALARYNADGNLDTTFGTNGKVTWDVSGNTIHDQGDDSISALVIQPDGKIVTAGGTQIPGVPPSSNFVLLRFNADGNSDSTFGNVGRVISPTRGGANAIALQPDGKIVVVGAHSTDTCTFCSSLVRYNINGSFDSTFGSGGITTNDLVYSLNAMALQPDGKIVVAGNDLSSSNSFNFALARYNPDGSLDTAFGSGGLSTTDFFGFEDDINVLALQPDGRIVAAGYAFTNSAATSPYATDFAIARYFGGSIATTATTTTTTTMTTMTTSTTTTTTTTSTTTTTMMPNYAPSADSVAPVNITTAPGTAQNFTAIYSDPNGYMNISTASLAFWAPSFGMVMDYNRSTNQFTMAGADGSCAPGQAAIVTDGYLTLNCSASSVSGSGTTLTVTFNLTPQPPPSGAPYLEVISVTDQSGQSESKTVGTWIINRPPGVDSSSPMNSMTGVGMGQMFTVVYSDPDGYQNIAAANFYLSGNGGMHNEWLHYLAAPNLFTMMGTNDVCTPGQMKMLTNGYLTLDCSSSSVSGSGTQLTVIFQVTPEMPSSGIQYNIFDAASDQAGGAYATFAGTWMIE